MRIAIVTSRMSSGEQGGAEALYQGMLAGLRDAGHEATQVEVTVDESTFEGVLQGYRACSDLDLSDFELVISTKVPTYMVRHRNHVSYLLHTIRVFYDMFEVEYGAGTELQHEQRRVIHALDQQGLHPGRVLRHFTNGSETYRRLWAADPFWWRLRFQALHHPPALQGFRDPALGEYVFLPSRLHRWKRADLVIRAFRHLDRDIRLKISGTGEDEAALRDLAAGDPRIEFLGKVDDEELLDLYAKALVVPFVPLHEDYGLVTVEAFRSRKPVITCTDSGEPTWFVRDFENGFVVPPQPEAIADRLAYLVDHPDRAAAMGERGFTAVAHIDWPTLVEELLRLTRDLPVQSAPAPHHGRLVTGAPDTQADREAVYDVAVLDMQPIDPPIGGGRIRLLGLYHGLGRQLQATYVGTYDWPGEAYRVLRHSESLEEVTIPLTGAHFAAAGELRARTAGKTVIDVSFDLLAQHSPEFVERAVQQTAGADIVIFSHPWVYPLVREHLAGGRQLVVYDSQNVEGFLRTELLDDGGAGTELAKHVIAVEAELCSRADLVLACSHEDRRLFHELYGVPYEKLLVVPNGVFSTRTMPAGPAERQGAKDRLGLPAGPLALFIGSPYPPNVEAGRFICTALAPALPDVTFAICGCGPETGAVLPTAETGPQNVRLIGRMDEATKQAYLAAADLAVNPMFSGSGTNIKMFDFAAAGLPVVATQTGARGIAQKAERAFVVCDPEEFAQHIGRLLSDSGEACELGQSGRRLVEEHYSWERISAALGTLLHRRRRYLGTRPPRFSVIIPTYERHERLWELMECLAMQTCRDFEVIVVDQSAAPWNGANFYPDLDLLYLHTDVRGAVAARNTGAFHARGEILAFTDDDCLPLPDWLEHAGRHFEAPDVAGLEGLILSDKRDDPDFRAVTNAGFEGIGFMTANLFLRRTVFMAIDGFDPRFDHPHFREDTDLAWRAFEQGQIPFGRDVRVYHPPHRRDTERESLGERNRFFEKDALLLQKHPERYRNLFLSEAHYKSTAGFWEHFLRGADRYGVKLDSFYTELRQANGSANGHVVEETTHA